MVGSIKSKIMTKKLTKFWIIKSQARNSTKGLPIKDYTEAKRIYDNILIKSDWQLCEEEMWINSD